MILISYMKFQTVLYLESTHTSSEYSVEDHLYTIAETHRVEGY
jgi:hypothetical protein